MVESRDFNNSRDHTQTNFDSADQNYALRRKMEQFEWLEI